MEKLNWALLWKKLAKLEKQAWLEAGAEDAIEREVMLDALQQVMELPDNPVPQQVRNLRRMVKRILVKMGKV